MEAYTGFAAVYDTFMDNIPYKEWKEYIVELLKKDGIHDGLILDLGCGTGTMTALLAQAGYEMIGVDDSEEMLSVAREKCIRSDYDILYLQQDMREFELYGTVRAVISICDSINYITTETDLLKVFRLINNYLDPGGLFIFDMNTIYKYETVMADSTFAEDREESSFIWDNYYYEAEMMNEYNLSVFIKEKSGFFKKYLETHYQKAYEIDTIKNLLEQAGMEFVGLFDSSSKSMPSPKSERVYFIAREKGK